MVAIANQRTWRKLFGSRHLNRGIGDKDFVTKDFSKRPKECWFACEIDSGAYTVCELPTGDTALLIFTDEAYSRYFLMNAGLDPEDFDILQSNWQDLVDELVDEYKYVVVNDTIDDCPLIFRLV